jgi:hypothetical protein
MYCRNCGGEMNDNQAICLKCGVATGTGDSYCSNCGNPVAPNAAVCLSCGVAIQKPAAKGSVANGSVANGEYLGGQDKVTMALVCFFLGGFGIHNFMMGEKKKGIIRIVLSLLCGIGGILALIDFVKILTDKYVVELS